MMSLCLVTSYVATCVKTTCTYCTSTVVTLLQFWLRINGLSDTDYWVAFPGHVGLPVKL